MRANIIKHYRLNNLKHKETRGLQVPECSETNTKVNGEKGLVALIQTPHELVTHGICKILDLGFHQPDFKFSQLDHQF